MRYRHKSKPKRRSVWKFFYRTPPDRVDKKGKCDKINTNAELTLAFDVKKVGGRHRESRQRRI